MKKLIAMLLVSVLVLSLFTACGNTVKSIEFVNETIDMFVGETCQADYHVEAENLEKAVITLTSSDESVATVNDKGEITAVGVGSAQITAVSGKITASCTIRIKKRQTAVIDTIKRVWIGSTTNYAVGDSITLNEYGMISEIKSRNDNYTFYYDKNARLISAENQHSNGTDKYQWGFDENNIPVSKKEDPASNYRVSRKGNITCKINDKKVIEQLTESEILTDPEDGSVTKSTNIRDYKYKNGRISSIDYTIDQKKDHTTYLSYDENGNITVYSSVGGSMGEYLRYEITYKMVDEDTVKKIKVDPFIYFINTERILSVIL